MSKKVELLAPAGNYESFLGAIHAGADAVYLAGSQFGARAYADNFSEEEVCKAIYYAHLYHRKVYLTVNILLKEEELETLYSYLLPYYVAGLDGVIVQDMGVFLYIRDHFKGLELHVSTQMCVTGAYGAALLKELGACRIVPARELSLDEIRFMKQEAKIEIETFIHGSLCYSYSGTCLFSSILGGRSGNRGRCAQPCRLPYQVFDGTHPATKEEQYVLSLKDMCTIQMIPQLIEAGIDSFKIEGRMKKPEYAAGVTAIYRKYIDRYYEHQTAPLVEEQDIQILKHLYIRSELQDGYYQKHNSAKMITLSKPSYSGSDDVLLDQIRAAYMEQKQQIPITGLIQLHIGEPAALSITAASIQLTVFGNIVEQALGHPLEEASIRKQIQKTGTSNYKFTSLKIEMDPEVFLPLKTLNELRRQALEHLENELLQHTYREAPIEAPVEESVEELTALADCTAFKNEDRIIAVSVLGEEQLKVALKHKEITRIYLSADYVMDHACTKESLSFGSKELYLALPYLIRQQSYDYLNQLEAILVKQTIDGVLIRSQEEWGWLKAIQYTGSIVTDAGLYCYNSAAKRYYQNRQNLTTVPYELNLKELLRLGIQDMEVPVYGRIPMMITANCVRNTTVGCQNSKQDLKPFFLLDRYQKRFPVLTNCRHCYNVIYNSTPTSLHSYMEQLLRYQVRSLRLDFTVEEAVEVEQILTYYAQVIAHPEHKFTPPYAEYTKGHLGRGVE
ncbi:MAG: U32 family peptidase [Lachnospiraceae bacterium]